MYGYIYLTTNLINGKKYIGKHKWSKLDIDYNYLGSGKILRRAIDKYGKENFFIKVLGFYESKIELDNMENFWTKYFGAVNDPKFYNLCEGGNGGNLSLLPNLPLSKEAKDKISLKNKGKIPWNKGKKVKQKDKKEEALLVKDLFEKGLKPREIEEKTGFNRNWIIRVTNGYIYSSVTGIKDKRGIDHNGQKGELNPSAKLKDKEVLTLLEDDKKGFSRKELSEKYGISKTQISKILLGRNYSHITGIIYEPNPNRKGVLTGEEKSIIVKLREKGLNGREIADQISRSKCVVYKFLKTII